LRPRKEIEEDWNGIAVKTLEVLLDIRALLKNQTKKPKRKYERKQ
jgi:hypothetical protein